MPQTPNSNAYTLASAAVMTSVTCVLAQVSIPLGPIPLSFTSLAVFLSVYLLGWKMGAVSCLVYLCIGLAGVPVFAGFNGGAAALLGPTGGYLIGFIPMAVVAGIVIEKTQRLWLQLFAMAIGTAITYTLGTIWFCSVTETTFGAAAAVCVLPFIPGDLIKIGIAAVLGRRLKRRLRLHKNT